MDIDRCFISLQGKILEVSTGLPSVEAFGPFVDEDEAWAFARKLATYPKILPMKFWATLEDQFGARGMFDLMK